MVAILNTKVGNSAIQIQEKIIPTSVFRSPQVFTHFINYPNLHLKDTSAQDV